MFDSTRMQLEYTGDQLTIRKPVKTQLGNIFLILTPAVLFILAIGYAKGFGENFQYIVFFGIICIALGTYKPIIVIVSGEYFTFDQPTQQIYRKGTAIADFKDVSHVEVKSISDSESTSYALRIKLTSELEIKLDESNRENEIRRVAGEVAYFMDKEIRQK